jgi:chromosome segregation ATPase
MEIESLAKQRDSLAALSKKWELAADEVTQGIAALKAVSRKGVSPAVVISYQQALTEAGIDPQSFQQLVAEFGGLEQVLAARRGELKGLAEALETKARALEELKAEEAKIKESISTLRNAAVKHIQGTVHSATSEVKKLCQALSADIMKWGEVRAEMGKCENELKLARCFAQLPLSDEALSSLVEDISIPIVTQYLTIALVWCQTKLNLKLRPPRAILKKYYTINEYTDVELTDIITWALLAFMEGMGNVQRRV